ncbi:MAG: Panacea domain-containing protein [Defluviitaleaceae bacterium]|nr:Panacea domain-containing protein [Defluviitaleaceae bacterium]
MMSKIENSTAYVIKRIKTLKGENPGKKALQKLVFLMVEKGIPLNYEFGIHFYGPYCDSLSMEINSLRAYDVVNIVESGYSHKINVNDSIEILPSGLTDEHIQAVDDVIIKFKNMSPSDLELLTTAIYAYNHLEDKSKESVTAGVKKIKGEKYPDDKIRLSLNDFAYFNKAFS